MRMIVLQHADMDGPGFLSEWARQRPDVKLEIRRLDRGAPVPGLNEFDWLVSLGGPMNADEDDSHPWMRGEKALLRSAIESGKRVLGICLGAQLIARAFGALVTRNAYPEIGWFPIRTTAEGRQDPLFRLMPQSLTVYHWHGDTFAIPAGAVRVAESDACPNQAFTMGPHVLGLQFHMEVSAADVERFVENGSPDPARYVQGAAEMAADAQRYADSTRFAELLDQMTLDSSGVA